MQPRLDETSETRSQARRYFTGTPVPSLWLFGKAQSGKTSLVRFLTGADQAVIGNGYLPETKATYRYTFPTESTPVLRFFDTRGLGEGEYDPAEDIDALRKDANAVLVTVRVNDFALSPLIEPLERIRRARPSRPVILVVTCLHNLYPQRQHPVVDPYGQPEIPPSAPEPIRRCLAEQKRMFEGLVDRMVPVDLTKPDDGFDEPNFGGDRLKDALIDLLPSFLGEAIVHTDDALAKLREELDAQSMRSIRKYAAMAAGLGAIPVPWIDIAAVSSLQMRLAAQIAAVYEQPPLPATLWTGLPALGGRVLLRQSAKLIFSRIPLVGIPVNAATAFLSTMGLGRAASWYYWQRMLGRIPTSEEFQSVVGRQVDAARTHWNRPTRTLAGEEL